MKEVQALYKHTAIYSLAGILNRAPGFVLIPLYTKFLEKSEYGTLGVISITSEIIGASIGLKLGTAVSRLYFDETTPKERNEVVTTALIGLATMMALVMLPIWALSRPLGALLLDSSKMGDLLTLGIWGLLLNSLFTLGLQYLQIRQRSKAFLVVSSLRSVVYLTSTAVLVAVFRQGLRGALLGILIGNSLAAAGLIIPLLWRLGFRFSRQRFRSLIRFGLPLVPGELAEIGGTFSERYLVVHLISLAASGVYYLAFRAGALLNALIIGPFGRIFLVRRFEAFGAGEEDKEALRAFTYFFLVVTSAAVGLGIMAPEVVGMLAPNSYRQAINLVPLVGLTQVLISTLMVAELGIYYAKVPRHITTATGVGLVVQILMNLLLIPRFGIVGAACAAVVSTAVRLSVTVYLSRSLGGSMPEWRPIGAILGTAFAWFAVSRAVGTSHGWAGVATRACMTVAFPFAIFASPLFTKEERAHTAQFVRVVILRMREAEEITAHEVIDPHPRVMDPPEPV